MNDHPLAGIAPPPPAPPAPTPADGARAAAQTVQWVRSDFDPATFVRQPPASPPVQGQPQAQVPETLRVQDAQPVAVAAAAPAAAPAKAKKKPNVYAWIVGGVLITGVGLAYSFRSTKPAAPTQLEQNVSALATQVSALAAGAGRSAAEPVEVNPLSAMPCAVTNDARRFIGVDGNGQLMLAPSVAIARQVYDLVRAGNDYKTLQVRTGVSITQLEVAASGRGVALFDCGAPPAVATAAPATATTVKAGE